MPGLVVVQSPTVADHPKKRRQRRVGEVMAMMEESEQMKRQAR